MQPLCFPSLQSQYYSNQQSLTRPFGEKQFPLPTVVQATVTPSGAFQGSVDDSFVVYSPTINERLISRLFEGEGIFSDKHGDMRVYSFVEGNKRIVEIRSNDLHSRTRSTFDWYDFPTALNRYCPTTYGLRGSRVQAEHVAIALVRAAYMGHWEVIDTLLSEPAVKDRGKSSDKALRAVLSDSHTMLELL